MENKEIEKNVVIQPYSCKPRAPREVYSELGEDVLPENEYFVKDGVQDAKAGKGIPLAPYLLASQAQTDLACIIARLNAGDESVVNVRPDGVSGDFVTMPKNINDVNNLGKNMKKIYSSLSDDVKALFKDEKSFYNACLDGSLKDILAQSKKSEVVESQESVEPKSSEVVEEPSGKEEK